MDNNRFAYGSQTNTKATTYDAGLRSHMSSVYNRMTAGVALTGLVAWLLASTPSLMMLFMGGPQAYLFMFAPIVVLWFGFRPDRMSSQKLMLSFLGIAVLYGISFSVIAVFSDVDNIARAFFVTAAAFAGLSIFGYTTKKNLDAFGSFLIMGMFGILILSIVSLFIHAPLMVNVISAAGIFIFAGLTAWETQRTKEMYHASYGKEANSRMAWAAALNLYISFIAMFQYILHFMNQR